MKSLRKENQHLSENKVEIFSSHPDESLKFNQSTNQSKYALLYSIVIQIVLTKYLNSVNGFLNLIYQPTSSINKITAISKEFLGKF